MKLVPLAPHAAPTTGHRARRHPRAFRMLLGALFLASAYLTFLGFLGNLAALVVTENAEHGYWALGLLALCGFFRALAGLNHRHLHCPVCHGEALRNPRCHVHPKARKYPFLSRRAAVVIDILRSACFRCTYCGTGFRLWG